MKRLFIAIKIEKSPKLEEVVQGFTFEKNIKWVDINNLHLTLAFLGSTEEALIAALQEILNSVCSNYPVINLELTGIGTFGGKRSPHVLWVGLKENKELLTLQSELHKKLTELGVDLEERAFKPHVTLGRIKRIEKFNLFNELVSKDSKTNFGRTSVPGVILFESKLNPSGPVYRELYVGRLK